jgi:hypothetical protein
MGCAEHLRACQSRSPLDIRADKILLDWPKFKAMTKDYILIKQLPKGEKVFMRTTPTCTYDPPVLSTFAWVLHYWLIDASASVLSPTIATNLSLLKPIIVITKLKSYAAIKEADNYLSSTIAMVIMDPWETEALMRFIATMSFNGLSSKADTLIDTAA